MVNLSIDFRYKNPVIPQQLCANASNWRRITISRLVVWFQVRRIHLVYDTIRVTDLVSSLQLLYEVSRYVTVAREQETGRSCLWNCFRRNGRSRELESNRRTISFPSGLSLVKQVFILFK